MIGRIRGELLDLGGTLATVDCGGVGYEVTLPEDAALRLPDLGARVDLVVRQIVREDGSTLYGFASARDRRVFDLLLKVNGCGPKVALALVASVGPEGIVRAVLNGDARPLTAATGVGKRLGERIVLELGPAIADEAAALALLPGGIPGGAPKPDGGDRDLVDALVALGYRPAEAERAAAEVGPEGDLDRRIVAALQRLKR